MYVAAGDINGDGKAELAVGSGVGLQQVNVYNGTGTQLRSYTIGDPAAAQQGVPLAMADMDGDGKADLLIADGTDMQVRNPLDECDDGDGHAVRPDGVGGRVRRLSHGRGTVVRGKARPRERAGFCRF